jgi:hypothetical protein
VRPRRARRPDAAPAGVALPEADVWYDPTLADHARRRELAAGALPDLQATRAWLVDTLETTLELLAGVAVEDDASLYFHRLALFHEEMHAEAFAVLAQTLGIDTGLVARIATAAPRPPLLFPATRWLLGTSGVGFRFDNEAEPHPVDVPEFEIDAQAVTWAQFGEFVEDGGYDERVHWSDAGWDWLQREGRRTPRHVDQMRHGVLQRRFGVLARAPRRTPRCTSAGTRPRPGAAGPIGACRARSSGKRRRTRGRRAASAGATSGNGRRPPFGPIPASSPDRGATTRCRRSARTRCCAGRRSRRGPSLVSARFRGFARAERDDGFFGFRSCAK